MPTRSLTRAATGARCLLARSRVRLQVRDALWLAHAARALGRESVLGAPEVDDMEDGLHAGDDKDDLARGDDEDNDVEDASPEQGRNKDMATKGGCL